MSEPNRDRDEVYCHQCSLAGGAERGVYHAPPVCPLAADPHPPVYWRPKYRAAIARVWSPEDADNVARYDRGQSFDFFEDVRITITIEAGVDDRLILHVAGEAIRKRPPLTDKDLPHVLWQFQRVSRLHDKPLHLYHDGHRCHLAFAAPPGSGEPVPPEPTPEPGPDAPAAQPAEPVDLSDVPESLINRIPPKAEPQ